MKIDYTVIMGAIEIPRSEYLKQLNEAVKLWRKRFV